MDALAQIKRHAARTGHSLRGLFVAAGVSYSNWGRWEKGTNSPTMRTLDKLLNVKRRKKAARA